MSEVQFLMDKFRAIVHSKTGTESLDDGLFEDDVLFEAVMYLSWKKRQYHATDDEIVAVVHVLSWAKHQQEYRAARPNIPLPTGWTLDGKTTL